MKFKYLPLIILMIGIFNAMSLFSQTKSDNQSSEEFEEWKYLNLDISYGSSGPGGALGFKYSFFGFGISATGFANDIPNTVPRQGNADNIEVKKYPSNTVCADFYGYYDYDEISAFVSIGYYSSIDSILLWDTKEHLYYKHDAESKEGLCWGLGAQMPLTFLNEDNVYLDQIVGGIGFHSRLGVYLRIAYRW